MHLIGGLLPPLAAGVAGLALAAWLAGFGFGIAAVAVLAGWLVLIVATVLAVVRSRRASDAMHVGAIASQLELAAETRRGSITTLLEPLAPGTSSELHHAAAQGQVAWVSAHGSEALEPVVTERKQRSRRSGIALAVAALALLLARPLGGAPAMLWQPWQAWMAIAAPIRLSATDTLVDRGVPAELAIVALGQQRATLRLRAPGEAWRDTVIDLDADGRAAYRTAPLENELVARVRAGGRTSPELHLRVRMPTFLGALTITASYPNYLGAGSETLQVDGDTIVVPEGTRLEVTGRATAPLRLAELQSGADTIAMTLDGGNFVGEFTPRGLASWRLVVEPQDGGVPDGIPAPFVISVLADSAPTVTIPVPGADTTMPASRRLPLLVAIEDDHGIADAAIEARVGRSGEWRRIPLGDVPTGTDRALLNTVIDLDSFRIAAGDTLFYAATSRDNSPRRQLGRSRQFFLRVPTAAEQRVERQEATDATRSGLDSLSAAARRAQREAEDQARTRQRGQTGNNATMPEPMTAEAARRAEQVAEAQRDVEERLAEMQRAVAELEQAAERQGIADSALASQLGEIRELLESAITPELREAMQRLQESLQQLDGERSREALRDLGEQQQRMREAIERARELFERAAMEAELGNLAEQARELAQQQQQATEQLATDSAGGASRERELAATADSLADALESSAAKVPSEQTEARLQQSADAVRQAASEMRNAAKSAEQGEQARAEQQAQSAGEMLAPVEQDIREGREAMQEAMREEVIEALDRLLAETARLLSRQHAVAESLRRGALAGPIRAEESMIEEATAKLFQQVIAVSGKNALISPRIGVALAGARDGIRGAIDATSSANPSLGLAADRAGEAVDMLALAAYSLLRSRENIDNSQSGSGLAEAMAQMQSMAGQQSQLSEQGQAMLQQGGGELGELMRLAMQQRAIAQQLERMRAQGQMPGAGEFATEARQLSRELEQGQLTAETISRQERLFRRMLDAGRTLEGEERDETKKRQSESASPGELSRPDAIDPRLLRGTEYPPPGWDALQRLGPDDRRRVLDYFRRLAESVPG